MNNLREKIYRFALTVGLFYVMPLICHLPPAIMRGLLYIKALIRFTLGNYRSYINRPGLKTIAIKNISNVLGLEDKIAKKKILLLMLLEIYVERNSILLDKYTLSTLKDQFSVNGLDILEDAMRQKRGVILAAPHAGDIMLLALFLSMIGYDIYCLFDGAIQQKEVESPLHRFAKLKDAKITGKIGKLYTGRDARKIFDVLNNNGTIIWMTDLPAANEKRKTYVKFLGSMIGINNSFWDIAIKSNALILPLISIFDCKKDKHSVYISNPLGKAENSIQILFNFYEPFIQRYPESWIGWYYFDMLRQNIS